jgi:hypothetical protein
MLTSQRHARSWTSASPSRCTTRRRKRDDGARAAVGGDQRGLRIGLRTTFAGTPSHGCISRNCGWERACSFWARQKRRSRSCAASRRSNLRVDTYTRQTFGCDTCRAIRTSLRKRASAASLVCAAWEMNFSATGERGPRRESTLLDREDGGHGAAKGRPSGLGFLRHGLSFLRRPRDRSCDRLRRGARRGARTRRQDRVQRPGRHRRDEERRGQGIGRVP